MRLLFLLFFIAVLLAGCADDKGEAKSKRPSRIYAHYQFNGDEGKEMITGLLQFFEGGIKGKPIQLQPPAGIQLDGVALKADSALQTGAYYEVQLPVQTFTGEHILTLTDEHGQTHKQTFGFEPLVLETTLPQIVKRGNLELAVNGLEEGEKVRVLLIDISFDTDDINRLQSPTGGKLIISAEDLQQVASGPVTLMLYKEKDQKLEKELTPGGRLSITYSLSREFELVD